MSAAARRRLLALAERQQDAHLQAARSAVVAQHARLSLVDAQKALEAALSLPRARRGPALRDTLGLIGEVAQASRTPPPELLGVIRRAVRDRVSNSQDLAILTDASLIFGDTRELQARAVAAQRKAMNGYWAGETVRFRNDASATIREAIRRGLDPEKAADLLQARLGVHRSRAVGIVLDQTRTATARAEQSLLRAAGVKEFEWWSARIASSRPGHVQLHGRVFSWRGAPELPGAAINCTCRALVPSKS